VKFNECPQKNKDEVVNYYTSNLKLYEGDWWMDDFENLLSTMKKEAGVCAEYDDVGFDFGEDEAHVVVEDQYIYPVSFDVFCGGLNEFVNRVVSVLDDYDYIEEMDIDTVRNTLYDAIKGDDFTRASFEGRIGNDSSISLKFTDTESLLSPLDELVDEGVLTDEQLARVYDSFDAQAEEMCDKIGAMVVKHLQQFIVDTDDTYEWLTSEEHVAQVAEERNWDIYEDEDGDTIIDGDTIEEEDEEEEYEEEEEEEKDNWDEWSDDPAVWAARKRGRRVFARR